jgi:hypothetical protein
MSQPEPTDLENELANEDRLNEEEAMRGTRQTQTAEETNPAKDADNAAD